MDFIKIMQDDKIIGVLNLQYDFKYPDQNI